MEAGFSQIQSQILCSIFLNLQHITPSLNIEFLLPCWSCTDHPPYEHEEWPASCRLYYYSNHHSVNAGILLFAQTSVVFSIQFSYEFFLMPCTSVYSRDETWNLLNAKLFIIVILTYHGVSICLKTKYGNIP